MNDRREPGQDREAGLCASCRHGQVVVSDRGQRYIRCRRSATDPAYPRYPMLPVRACAGHESDEIPVS